MSQRSPQRRASTPPRRGRSPSRTPSRQLDVEVKPAVSAGGLVHYSRYIVPICAALACLVVATLLLRSYVLLFAAKSMPPLVPVFLELGANPRAQDSYGGSPLHAMCASGTPSEHTYRLLLEYGSDLSDTDFFALQPVHYCSVSSPALALQMLRDGARPSPGSSSLIHPLLEAMLAKYQPFSNEVLDYLKVALSLSRPDAANLPLGSGLSPLAAAFLLRAHAASPEVAAHALDFAALLLAKGADSGALHPEGAPLLHYTLQFCSGLANDDAYDDAEARRDFLDVLLDAPALNVSQRDVDQRTALFFACNSSLVTLLVERGADPNAVSLLGETPLEYRLRLLHDSNAPALEAGVIGALHRNGAHLGNTSRLLTALVLDDSALKTPLADHLAQLVAFATQELRLPFLRLLDVGERDTELCLTERDVLFYTKHQVPPIKSVLNGHLEITAIRGEFLVSESGVPIAGSAPTTSLRIALRELERVYLRPARKGECITLRASLRSQA